MLLRLLALSISIAADISPCDGGQCFPATGDLLIGRGKFLSTNSTCGLYATEDYCIVSNTNGRGSCFTCDSEREWDQNDQRTHESHRVQNIITTRANQQQDPWWQSENGVDNVYIQLDLEAQFSFTHLIMTFKTFRPAAMVVQRSSDNGATWKPYRYFAEDCSQFPDVELGPIPTRIDEVICDDSYNKKVPSTKGEIVLKVLEPQLHKDLPDPYAPEVMELLKVTNLRIEFLKLHTLGDDHIDSSSDSIKKYYYALYNLVVRGSCFCYGHASSCAPMNPGDPSNVSGMVHGRCACEHSTTGLNCEQCLPFFQDAPWRPANVEDKSECRRCNCHHHSEKCHFDEAVWEATGQKSGGVCDECEDNTEGRLCERCVEGYFHDQNKELADKSMCVACDCDPNGSLNDGICDRETNPDEGTIAGKCHCKPNVMGERCDQCKPGFHSLDPSDPLGCKPCDCDEAGSNKVGESFCDANTGQCHCRRNTHGERCDSCISGTYGLSGSDGNGCKDCNCDVGGSLNRDCNHLNGQCNCRENIEGQQCNRVRPDCFLPDITQTIEPYEEVCDENKLCIEQFTSDSGSYHDSTTAMIKLKPILVPMAHYSIDPQNPLSTGHDIHNPGATSGGSSYYPPEDPKDSSNPTDGTHKAEIVFGGSTPTYSVQWTSYGFVKIYEGGSLSFRINNIPRSMSYQLHLRYQPMKYAWEEVRVEIVRPDVGTRMQESPCFNVKPSDDVWTASLPATNNSAALGTMEPCLETDKHKGTNDPYTINLTFSEYSKQNGPKSDDDERSWIMVDSLVLVPAYQQFPIFDPTVTRSAPQYMKTFENEKCLLQELQVNKIENMTHNCDRMTYSIAAWLHNGADDCNCNKQGSTDLKCNARGGQCPCREGVYGRTCEKCKPGFFSFSSKGCSSCECNRRGTVDAEQVCNRDDGKCECRPGVGGRQCDQCLSGYFGFPECQKCDCNGHANECDAITGICITCGHNTKGNHCAECSDGYYGDPKIGSTNNQCTACPCPDGPGSGRQFASSCKQENPLHSRADDDFRGSRPDMPVIVCECNDGFTGPHCDQCAPGYFGNPHEQGGTCQPCECNGNININDPDACDARTGDCLMCLYNRASPDCVACADGYFEENGECIPCLCDDNGSDPESKGICDKSNGQCKCLNYIDGRTCNKCRSNFYDLVGASDVRGCKACACDPENSIDSALPCDEEHGQCNCKSGFGGRDCSTCEEGYYGEPKRGDCKACNCDPSGTNGSQVCESWSGQCQCIEGVGGLQCDECARGFKGVVPYCEPCGECFESWDSIITGLIEDTANVLEKVANIQEKGVAGAYDSQFAEIEKYLNNAKSVLESNKDMKKLEDFMGDIESETTRGETRLADIHGSFVEIEELNDTQKRELHEIEQTIETYRNELKELSTKLDRVEAKDPIILWQRIDEAVRNATKYEILAKKAVGLYNNAQDPETNFLLKSKIIRKEVEDGMTKREEEFLKESQELDELIDQTEPKLEELTIAEINEQVCGVATEDCDEMCGGALCKLGNNLGHDHCGNSNYDILNRGSRPDGELNTCDQSAYQMAKNAQTHAQSAKQRLENIQKQVSDHLTETEPIRDAANSAKEKATEVNTQANNVEQTIREYNDKILTLVNEITDFLNRDYHTEPENILKVAQDVLDIKMPDQALIDNLKKQMSNLGIEKPTDPNSDEGIGFGEVSKVAQAATDVLRKAQVLANQVNTAIENYSAATENCNLAKADNIEANKQAVTATGIITSTVEKIKNLSDELEKLTNFVSGKGAIGQQMTDLNRKVTEANSNVDTALKEADEAKAQYDETKEKLEKEKAENDLENRVNEFTDSIDKMRQTQMDAKDLESNVQSLIDEVDEYKQILHKLKSDYKDVKEKVNKEKLELKELQKRAVDVREHVHKKLYVSQSCDDNGR